MRDDRLSRSSDAVTTFFPSFVSCSQEKRSPRRRSPEPLRSGGSRCRLRSPRRPISGDRHPSGRSLHVPDRHSAGRSPVGSLHLSQSGDRQSKSPGRSRSPVSVFDVSDNVLEG